MVDIRILYALEFRSYSNYDRIVCSAAWRDSSILPQRSVQSRMFFRSR